MGAASWSGHGTCLNRLWTAAPQNMPRVRRAEGMGGWRAGWVSDWPRLTVLPSPAYPAQPCTCCTHSWRRSGAWPGMPWPCTSAPPGPWSPPSSTTCSTSTSSGRPRSMGSPTPVASTRRPLRYPLPGAGPGPEVPEQTEGVQAGGRGWEGAFWKHRDGHGVLGAPELPRPHSRPPQPRCPGAVGRARA